MRGVRVLAAVSLIVLYVLVVSCSKKSTPPTAPPAPTNPICSLSTTALDFGTVTVGSSADRTFTLTNTGGGTLAGTAVESCSEFSLVGPVAYSLEANQSATFTVRFAPGGAGSKNCVVDLGASSCADVACAAIGTTATSGCAVSPTSLDFSAVGIGDRADLTFTLTNTGTGTLTGTVSETCPSFSIAGLATYTLDPGQNQVFIVRFEPSQVGGQACTVQVGPGCSTVECSGSGVAGCQFQPTALDFGYVRPGETRSGALTLQNTTSTVQGGTLYARTALGGTGGYAGTIALDGIIVTGTTELPYSLAPGASRVLTVVWNTQFANSVCDSILGKWRILSSNPTCSNSEVALQGVITRGCEGAVTPRTLDFGFVVVGDAAEQNVSITNESGIGLLSGQVNVLSGDFEAPTRYTCPAQPSGGCVSCGYYPRLVTVPISFRPTRLGAQTGKILIQNLAGCLGPGASTIVDTVTVTGTGILAASPECGVSTNTIDMGTVYFGAHKDTTLTIRNTGGGILEGSIAFIDNSPPFSIVGSTAYSLGPQASQDFTIRFTSIAGTPGHTYSYVGNIFTGTQCSAQGLDVQVTAIAAQESPPVPICQVTPDTLYFGSVAPGATKDLSFQITNVGTGILSGTAGPMPSACAEFSFVGPVDYNLGAGESATLTVRCAPTTSGGTMNCPLVPVNNLGAGCSELTLIGEVPASPTCVLVGGTFLGFGTVAVGTSKDLNIYMENWGEGTLCGSVTETCPDFSIVQDPNWCVTARPARVYRTIRFSPTSAGLQTCTINAGTDCPPITAQGTGN